MNARIRNAWWLLLLAPLVAQPVVGQGDGSIALEGPACELPSAPFEGHMYVPPPEKSQIYLDALAENPNLLTSSTITANYFTAGMTLFGFTCSAWPAAAMTAFDFAKGIWEPLLDSTPVMEVDACWTSGLPGGVLGIGGALSLSMPAGGVPSTWYNAAHANAIDGVDLGGAGSSEMGNAFNSTFSWYFGTDGATPGGMTDFVTVVLHELTHGLGFTGSADFHDGTDPLDCSGIVGTGCIGTGAAHAGDPIIYDRFTDDSGGAALLTYVNPGVALGAVLTGGTTSVFFDGTVTTASAPAGPKALYAPVTWAGGSSYSHFETSTFPGEIMKHSLPTGASIHSPGLALAVFEDMGWPIKIPVELTSFTAAADGEGMTLRWQTSSETNNAGFDVQMRGPGDESFISAGFVEGRGTTAEVQNYSFGLDDLMPGTYVFRLHQLDFDGRSEFSPQVEATIEVPDGYMLAAPYPNPFNPEAVVEFAIADSRPVRIELFNTLGQQVAVLFDGIPDAGQTQHVRIDGRTLPSGSYLVRLIGENILATQRLTLVK